MLTDHTCDKDNRLLHCGRLTDVAGSGSPVCMGLKDLLLPESLCGPKDSRETVHECA